MHKFLSVLSPAARLHVARVVGAVVPLLSLIASAGWGKVSVVSGAIVTIVGAIMGDQLVKTDPPGGKAQ